MAQVPSAVAHGTPSAARASHLEVAAPSFGDAQFTEVSS
jgi:hypothetical protein